MTSRELTLKFPGTDAFDTFVSLNALYDSSEFLKFLKKEYQDKTNNGKLRIIENLGQGLCLYYAVLQGLGKYKDCYYLDIL